LASNAVNFFEKKCFFFFSRDATLAYKAEALELQKQLRHLQSQFDMLTGQASTLIQGRRARVAATSTVNGHLTELDDSLSARNLEVHKL
jgi:HAUS augmin-like complex subunit 3